VGAIEVTGLHPATDSIVPYILGHIIPVPSETGKSHSDLDEQYLTASYRVYLTGAQARNVFAYIKQKHASSPIWQAGTSTAPDSFRTSRATWACALRRLGGSRSTCAWACWGGRNGSTAGPGEQSRRTAFPGVHR